MNTEKTMKATPEQIAVVEKRIAWLKDEIVFQPSWRRKEDEFEVTALTAVLDELKVLREQERRERQFICRKCGLRQELGEKTQVTF